jgi:hypothetical protein
MTDIEQTALAMVNAVRAERGLPGYERVLRARNIKDEALCRAVKQHEAFRQAVSFALATFKDGNPRIVHSYLLDRFIISETKPDPLVDVLADTFGASLIDADELRAALAARGLEIREND